MRLKYMIGLLATLLFTACSVSVDLEEPVAETDYTIQISYPSYTMPTLACKVVGLSSASPSGNYPDEVIFKATRNTSGVFECVVNLPAVLPTSAQILTDLDGKTYPIVADSDRIIKINK